MRILLFFVIEVLVMQEDVLWGAIVMEAHFNCIEVSLNLATLILRQLT